MAIRDNFDTFERAVRLFFNAPDDWIVFEDTEGGHEVQIGDMTWDTEPLTFIISVTSPDRQETKREIFNSLPDLIGALMGAEMVFKGLSRDS